MDSADDKEVVRAIQEYVQEAKMAKTNRMTINRMNFDCYHLNQDYSHKKKGQSREFLAKQAMAVEQIASFMEQGLIDVGQFFKVEPTPGNKAPIITMDEISKITLNQLEENKFHSYVADALKLGLLGSLMIAKVYTCKKSKPKYVVEQQLSEGAPKSVLYKRDEYVSELKLDLVRHENWYPDPTGNGLYVVEQIEMDLFELIQLAEANPKVYDVEVVKSLQAYIDEMDASNKSSETGQDVTTANQSRRKRVTIHECWGTILGPNGEVLHRNVVTAVANDQFLIRKPTANPFWHGKAPYVVAPLIRVPKSVWHKALMDAPTAHNQALNELYNLILDSGMMATYGIKQLRESWLDDPSQVEEGIAPATTLIVNSSCPPGGKVLERVDTANLSSESINVFQLTDREFQQSALVNDLRLGVLPERTVKATEIVAANQSISGVFSGIARIVETDFISEILDLSWMTLAQTLNEMDKEVLNSLIGEDRVAQILDMSPEAIFAGTVNGHKFKTFGISLTLNKVKDFKKLQGLLQTLATNPLLAQEFSRKYSFHKLMSEIVKSLDINEEKIFSDQKDAALQTQQKQQQGTPTLQDMLNSMMQGGGGPNMQSQIPQASTDNQVERMGADMSGINSGITTPTGDEGGQK